MCPSGWRISFHVVDCEGCCLLFTRIWIVRKLVDSQHQLQRILWRFADMAKRFSIEKMSYARHVPRRTVNVPVRHVEGQYILVVFCLQTRVWGLFNAIPKGRLGSSAVSAKN